MAIIIAAITITGMETEDIITAEDIMGAGTVVN